MKRKTTLPWLIVLIMMAAAALACNLTEQAPPTIPPRPTATPPPTIGYTPLAPNQLPEQSTAAPQSQTNMLSLFDQISTDRLMQHVQVLEGFGTRHIASPDNQTYFGIGAARDYISGQFQEISQQAQQAQQRFDVTQQPFPVLFQNENYTATNVIGISNGTETGAGVIILGAHYDSISFDFANSIANAPGANDNASGVAALIEIARVLSVRPHRQTLIFVAFSAEEVGRLGSQAFVRDYIQAYNLPVIGMLNMDIIGASMGPDGQYNDRQIRLFSVGPNDSPSRNLARTIDLFDVIYVPDMDIILEDAEDRLGRYSDHMSFTAAGYPAIRYIEATENRNRQHNDSDVSSAMQPQYLTHAAESILAVMNALSDGPRPPLNVSLRVNGDGTQTLFWEAVPGAASYLVVLRRPGSLEYSDYYVTEETSSVWDGFVSSRFEAIAVAARDANGLVGPLSTERYILP